MKRDLNVYVNIFKKELTVDEKLFCKSNKESISLIKKDNCSEVDLE